MEKNFKLNLPKLIEEFRLYGVKKLTMDDIARVLSISKRTLYKYVESKDDLVQLVMEIMTNGYIDEMKEFQTQVEMHKLNSVKAMLIIFKKVANHYKKQHSTVFDLDMQKYYPELHKESTETSKQHLLTIFKNILESGQADGHFMEGIKLEHIAKIWLSSIGALFMDFAIKVEDIDNEEFYKDYVSFNLKGLLTEKGLEQFYKEFNYV